MFNLRAELSKVTPTSLSWAELSIVLSDIAWENRADLEPGTNADTLLRSGMESGIIRHEDNEFQIGF